MLIPCGRADDSAANALIQKGDAEQVRDQPQSALAAYLDAEKAAPNRVDVLLRISKAYSDLVDEKKNAAEAKVCAEKSLAYAKRSADLVPGNAKAHLSLAIAYGKLTDFTNNRTKLEYCRIIKTETLKSIEIDPADDFAYHVLGRWNAGVASLNPMLRMLAKAMYGSVPEGSNEEAIRNLKKAIELAPKRIMHHVELAKVYAATGSKDLARQEWQTSLRLGAADSDERAMQQEAREALRR